jgi:hypothetical protein
LDEVHAVEAEGLDLDEGLAFGRFGQGGVRVDEEGVAVALAAFDVYSVLLVM